MTVLLRSVLVLLVLLSLACEPEAPRGVVPPQGPEATYVEVEPVVALRPGRTTLLAVDPAGNIYWLQREDRQPDVLFVRGGDGVPRATGLSSATVLDALGASQNGEGSIHSVAADQGQVWFYFQGGAGRDVLAAFGRYLVDSSEVEIIADTSRIQSLTRMGASLELARGTVLRSGEWLWLWVRHSDMAVLARLAADEAGQSQFVVDEQFASIEAADEPLVLTRAEYELAQGPGESLILLDRRWGSIWRVDPDGRAEPVEVLTGLPRGVSSPSYDHRGRILLFATESEPFPPRPAEPYRPPVVSTTYPALLMVRKGQAQAFGREDLRGQAGAVPYRLRLQQLVMDPGERSWLGYDEASGQIVRLTLR